MSDMSSEVLVKPTSPTIVDGEVVHDSEEYESAEEIEGEEDEEEVEEIEVEVEEEEGEEGEKDEGKEKQLDDDEDRKNPQFIPKKGYFYEHDDRMSGEPGGEEEEPQQKEERPKRETKVITDRWSHDLFNENEQAPKSNSELEEHYGYDIRKDDMAPRARRKRIYGRGPTKYTRNWEEEEAYQRPRGGFRGRRTGSRGRDFRQPSGRGSKGYDEDFPQLPEDNKKDSEEKAPEAPVDTLRNDRGGRSRGGRGGSERPYQRRDEDEGNDDRDRNFGRGGQQNRGGRGRGSRRNEFSNRNRYPDRRESSSSVAESNNSTNIRSKPKEERDWEQKVDRMREQDKVVQKQANGTRGNFSPSERDTSTSKNSGSGRQQQVSTKKSTLPFTNTEYTGSESLTAHRNQEPRSNSSYESDPVGTDRENISVKLINSGPDQGNREVRISDKDRWLAGNSGSGGADRRSQIPSRFQQQQPQSGESAKPKRFSSQRQKQDVPVNVAPVSASPPLVSGARGSPQPHGGVPPNPVSVPVSVISGYPTQHSQAYYDQVSVPMPTNYEAQGYEASGSPITVPITAHGPSVSPSLWTTQHAAYSTSSYPSPPSGPPSVQPGYDPSGYISSPQPQIFAPPPHPHPQFISDPTIINYVPPGPPPSYGAPFHPQGFQGYPQVNPGPELYHGGVTYYSPQTQISRPHMVVPTKRPKSVLQFVEPSKRDFRQGGPRSHLPSQEEALLMSDMYLHHQYQESLPHVVDYMNTGTSSEYSGTTLNSKLTTEQQLSQKFEESVTLQPKTEGIKKTPSPAPLDLSESQSWGDQMAELTPLSSPSDTNPPKNSGFQGEKPDAPSPTVTSSMVDVKASE